ncbi:MAG: PspA/IM30 family protein, partial [Pseudomonadales bacterium]|nr:PspA/IM30 family protein [Pseudomonadales bacterium]
MGVFNRISDIINSNINAMLDHAEDPEKMIRQITREMEETLVEVRSHSARNIAEKKDLVKRIRKYREEAASWEERAELAINKGRDDLARAALKERSSLEESVALLKQDVETI